MPALRKLECVGYNSDADEGAGHAGADAVLLANSHQCYATGQRTEL